MDTLTLDQSIIKRVLQDYTHFLATANGSLPSYLLFDDEHGHYALIEGGWQQDHYVHDTLIHIGMVNQQIWIHEDNTEEGIAPELVAAGIPKNRIVLGFRSPEVRPFTEFAVG